MNQEPVKQNETIKVIEARKFISMMNSLTWHIKQNPKHQENIFQCLNSNEQKKLFQSIVDQNQEVRITAVVFIIHLLNKNQKLLKLIMSRDGLDVQSNPSKYIVGGIQKYGLKRDQFINILKLINQLEEQQNSLFWSINIKTKKVHFLQLQKVKEEKIPNFFLYRKEIIDPKQNIIGIFTGPNSGLSKSKVSIKNQSSSTSLKGSYSQKYRVNLL